MKLNEIQRPLLGWEIKSVATIVNAVKKHFPDLKKKSKHNYGARQHTYELGRGEYAGKRASYFLENMLGPPITTVVRHMFLMFDRVKQITWKLHRVAMYKEIEITLIYPLGEEPDDSLSPVNMHITTYK